jgi:hypothetical protein
MKFEPHDIIRFAALVGGFLLCGLGALLMWLGVGAEGAVDIKSAVLSGSIKTGSAGLFTLFFGFGIIIFVLGSLNAKSANAQLSSIQRKSRTKHIAQAFWGILVAFLISSSLGALGYGAGFGPAALFLGCLLAFTGIAFVVQLDYE